MYQAKQLKKIILLFIFWLFISTNATAQHITEEDKIAIQKLTNKYKKAIASSEGENLYPLVTNSTIEFYNKIRSLSLFAKKEELLKEDLYVILLTMLSKDLFDFVSLRAMNAKEFFIRSFTGHSSTFNQGEDIIIDKYISGGKDKILVKYNRKSDNYPFLLPFVKEDGRWKVDIADMWRIYLGATYMRSYKKAQNEGYTKEQFILYITRKHFDIQEDDPFKRLTFW